LDVDRDFRRLGCARQRGKLGAASRSGRRDGRRLVGACPQGNQFPLVCLLVQCERATKLLLRPAPSPSGRAAPAAAKPSGRRPTAFAAREIRMDAKLANTKTGTLTIGEQSWPLPINEGTIGPAVLDIAKLYGQTGMFTYDPGFTSTAACESKITYIDGD